MKGVLPGSTSRNARIARVVAWLLGAAALAALALAAADGLDAAGRQRLVRMLVLLASGGMAVGAQYALYPSPTARRLQLSNPGPARLLRLQLGRWAPIPLVLAAAAAAAGWPDPTLMVEGALSVVAVGLFAFARVAALGRAVRRWEREEDGGWYRALYTWAPPVRFLVPDPLVPGMLRTGEVFLSGAVLAVAGQAVGEGLGALVAPVALLAVAAGLVARLRDRFDEAFWTSHGVWADAFRQVELVEGREPVRYDAVYWAPSSLRPAVWAGLVSMDRRLPLGRVAALALVFVAAVHLVDAGSGPEAGVLALYVLGLNGAVALSARDDVVPPALAHRLGGVMRWTAARFLMNVRWWPPLAATFLLLIWLAEDVGWGDLAVWTAVDLAAAALSALLVTLADRARFRRALA